MGTYFNEIWILFQENAIENVACQNGGHFVQGVGGDELIKEHWSNHHQE